MTDADVAAAVQTCANDLARIARDMPEMSGFALAYDRGNIDDAEWESVQAQARRLQGEENEVAARLDALRADDPAAMVRHIETLSARLRDAGVPEAIATLTAWAAGQPVKYTVTWAVRVAYQHVTDR